MVSEGPGSPFGQSVPVRLLHPRFGVQNAGAGPPQFDCRHKVRERALALLANSVSIRLNTLQNQFTVPAVTVVRHPPTASLVARVFRYISHVRLISSGSSLGYLALSPHSANSTWPHPLPPPPIGPRIVQHLLPFLHLAWPLRLHPLPFLSFYKSAL